MIDPHQTALDSGWNYIGDINPEYGGVWLKFDPAYPYVLDFVETVDMSNAGCEGIVIIQKGTVPIDCCSRSTLKSALECSGTMMRDLSALDREKRRVRVAYDLLFYGFRDYDHGPETLQTDAMQPLEINGTVAERYQTRGDLTGYINAKWLD